MKQLGAALACTFMLAGCGPSELDLKKAQDNAANLKSQVEQLQTQVQALQVQLEEERNGASRLFARGENEKASGDLVKSKQVFNDLIARYPEASEAKKAQGIIVQIDAQISAVEEKKRLEAERKAKEERIALAALDKNLKKKSDEIRGITFISHKSEPDFRNKVALYFGTKNYSATNFPLRIKLQYVADDWLFVESVTIKADDHVLDLGQMDFERDNSGGTIWEWVDQPVNHAVLNKVLSAKRVIVRFNGKQYYQDFTVPAGQLKAMREIQLSWKRYGGSET